VWNVVNMNSGFFDMINMISDNRHGTSVPIAASSLSHCASVHLGNTKII